MRTDQLYLTDIVEAAEAIARFIDGIDDASELQSDEMRQSAVLQKLIVIGEAASKVSSDLRGEYPEVPWGEVVAFRNFAVHAYFGVDWHIVWTTVTADVPALKQQIARILEDMRA